MTLLLAVTMATYNMTFFNINQQEHHHQMSHWVSNSTDGVNVAHRDISNTEGLVGILPDNINRNVNVVTTDAIDNTNTPNQAKSSTNAIVFNTSTSIPPITKEKKKRKMDPESILNEFITTHQQFLHQSNITTPWPNVTTYCFSKRRLIAGYRNQIMALTMLMLQANLDGHGQFLLESIIHKDTYGTDKFVPFEYYFDVQHWNTYYNATEMEKNMKMSQQQQQQYHPWSLPRLVHYDPILHHQWDTKIKSYVHSIMNGNDQTEPTHPYGYPKQSTRLAASYQYYMKGKGKFAGGNAAPAVNNNNTNTNGQPNHVTPSNDSISARTSRRNPGEILMLQGALRPHPTLQGVIDNLSLPTPYMTIHARVEPDMQRHPVCKDKKVLRLDTIIRMIEEYFPTPPRNIQAVFLPINRQYLEKEGTMTVSPTRPKETCSSFNGGLPPPTSLPQNDNNTTLSSSSSINWIAVDNLRVLNYLHDCGGMWNGTIPVIEFGTNALHRTIYQYRPSTSGAILNYFVGINATIFIGTEVSSFSHDVLATRFFRGLKNEGDNYKYLPTPSGIQQWITSDMVDPPGHLC
jgi:hypothetical protein